MWPRQLLSATRHATCRRIGRRPMGAGGQAMPSSDRIRSVRSPKAGTRSMRLPVVRKVAGGMRLRTGPAGEPTSRHRSRSISWGWLENSCMSRSCAFTMPAASSLDRTSSFQRSELVNPETAALLDRAFARVKAERGAATVAAPSHVGFALNLLHPPVSGC